LEEEGGLRGRIRLIAPEPHSSFYGQWIRVAVKKISLRKRNKLIVKGEKTKNNEFPWDEREYLFFWSRESKHDESKKRIEIRIRLIIPEEVKDEAIKDDEWQVCIKHPNNRIYSLYVERKSESEKWTYENYPDITVPSVFEMFIKVSDDNKLRGCLIMQVPTPEG
jgi:hypothetical protein